MNEIIEGVGNDVTFIMLFFALLVAVLIPMYVLRPSHITQQTTQHTTSDSPSTPDERAATETMTEPPLQTPSSANRPPDPSIPPDNPYSEVQQDLDDAQQSAYDMISLKLLHNERSTMLNVNKNITLLDLIRKAYPSEERAGQRIRLVFRGQLLQGDSHTLEQLHLSDNCVIHVVISEQQQHNQRISTSTDNNEIQSDLDLSWLFMPLIVSGVTFSWVGFFLFSNALSNTSLVLLSVLTSLVAIVWYNSRHS